MFGPLWALEQCHRPVLRAFVKISSPTKDHYCGTSLSACRLLLAVSIDKEMFHPVYKTVTFAGTWFTAYGWLSGHVQMSSTSLCHFSPVLWFCMALPKLMLTFPHKRTWTQHHPHAGPQLWSLVPLSQPGFFPTMIFKTTAQSPNKQPHQAWSLITVRWLLINAQAGKSK